jgi:NAD-dependent deacetylase
LYLWKNNKKMKKLVILTGAGMSAESGIATFRDSGGLWEQYKVEDVATPEAWEHDSKQVMKFYNQRRVQLLNCQPNKGHLLLAQMEQSFDVQIITQNVDNLHEAAGSTKVLHLHGELMKMRSTGPGAEVYDVDPVRPDYFIGDLCPLGYQLRPHIVWFGEAVPEIENAIKMVKQAETLVIIGTSLKVYPAAGLVNYAAGDCPIYLIDPNEISGLSARIQVIKKGASEGVEELMRMLGA